MNASETPVFSVSAPTYRIDSEPDHTAIGEKVDATIKQHFMGQTIVVRGISSSAHPGKSLDELIAIIKHEGTDRYDPDREGDRYENLQGKHIDLFAFRRKVTPTMQFFKDMTWGFYHGGIAIHGKPTRIDLLLIYDAQKLKRVLHQYEGRDDKKRDGFAFKDPANKPAALLGIVKVLG